MPSQDAVLRHQVLILQQQLLIYSPVTYARSRAQLSFFMQPVYDRKF